MSLTGYTKRNWANNAAGGTPVNSTNLGAMDNAIYNIDQTAAKATDYVAKAGDTMTGNLTISKSDYPAISLASAKGGSSVVKAATSSSTDMGTTFRDTAVDGTFAELYLSRELAKTDIKQLAILQNNGTPYKVYGEHNKPTPADIGADRTTSGSYVGTGAQTTVTINFSFTPKLVFITTNNSGQPYQGYFYNPVNVASVIYNQSGTARVVPITSMSWGSTSLSYTLDSTNVNTLNASGVTYNWIMLG